MPFELSTVTAARREGNVPGSGIRADVCRMWIEDFVVGVTNDRLVLIFAEQCHIFLVAEIDDLFVETVSDLDGDALFRMIGNEIHRSLHRVEIAGAVRADHQIALRWDAELSIWAWS